MIRLLLSLTACFFAAASFAADLPLTGWAQLDSRGALRIVNRLDYVADNFSGKATGKEDDQVVVDFMDFAGNSAFHPTLKREGNSVTFAGPISLGKEKAAFDLAGKAVVLSPERISYEISLSSAEPRSLKEAFFSLRYQRSMLDRELLFTLQAGEKRYVHKVKVSAAHKGGWIWSSPKGQQVVGVAIPLMHGMLRISGMRAPAMVCKYGALTGNIRFYLGSGALSSLSGKLELSFTAYPETKLDLSRAVNVGFTDETADDRKGGWTDQGAENDLRMLRPGTRRFGNVDFTVIDPAKNGGKSALAFANPARDWFLREAVIPVGNRRFQYLALLHAAAWCQGGAVGSIRVDYADGSHQEFSVEDRRDVGNWWCSGESFANATLVWQERNPSAMTGLYLSRFRLSGKPVKSVTFRTANRSVWLVVAATGIAAESPFPLGSDIESRFELKAGKQYKSFTFHKDIEPGSALDFSASLDAPPGKYGRLMIRNGRPAVEMRPDRPVRFFGGNLCEDANYLEHEQTDLLVDRMAKAGYNAARLHHFDNALIKSGARTPEFEPERLDKLFYLISRLKARGLYVTIDLYISRLAGFDTPGKSMFDVKSRLLFSEPMRANVREYSRKLLTTVNPYTKLALKDDPVLITVGLINEDPLFTHHEQYKYPNPDPERQALIEPVFKAWCAKNKLDPEKCDDAMWVRFVIDRHIAVFEEFKSFLTGIGLRAPLSDISCSSQFATAVARNRFDYVDNHFYFDHPTFPENAFQMPFEYQNRSSVHTLFKEALATGSTRIMGKPFTITEFNFCGPNRYRGENGPVMGGLAGLQEWDGIFRFQFYGYNRKWGIKPLEDGGHLGAFSGDNDPMIRLSEPMIHMLYLRGDVRAAERSAVLSVTPEVWKIPQAAGFLRWGTREQAAIPACFAEVGLVRRIGMEVVPVNASARPDVWPVQGVLRSGKIALAAAAPENFDPAAGTFVSSTGELFTDRDQGSFKVVTPKSEALVVPGKSLAGKRLRVSGNSTFSTIFAGALDNRPLTESRRILVLHLTDVRASGQRSGMIRDRLRIYNYGKFSPYLALRGSAEISLDVGSGNFTVNALDINGKVLKQIPVKSLAGGIAFAAATDCGPEGRAVFAYEVVRR